MISKINIPFNVIQRVNTSLRISREIPRSQLSYLKVIDLDQYSLNDRFQEYKHFNCSLEFNLSHLLTVGVMISSIAFLEEVNFVSLTV